MVWKDTISGMIGFRSLFRGAVPALSSAMIENSVLFTANSVINRTYLQMHVHDSVHNLSFTEQAMLGSFSGVFSSIAICAPEVIKCRLQNQHFRANVNIHPLIDTIGALFRTEGVLGFFRGLPALMCRGISCISHVIYTL